MEPDRIKQLLENLGLAENEAGAYAVIARSGPLTAVEIADRIGLEKPRIYDVLKNLDHKCFVCVQEGTPTRYMALPPSELVELVKERRETEKKASEKASDELVRMIEPAYGRASNPKELSYTIKGAGKVAKQGAKMLASARRASVVLIKDPGKWLIDRSSHKRFPGRIRVVTDKDLGKLEGVELKKQALTLDIGFIIADEKEFLIMTSEGDSDGYDTGVLIRSPPIAAGIEQLFDLMWKTI